MAIQFFLLVNFSPGIPQPDRLIENQLLRGGGKVGIVVALAQELVVQPVIRVGCISGIFQQGRLSQCHGDDPQTIRIHVIQKVAFFFGGVFHTEQAVVVTHFNVDGMAGAYPVERAFRLDSRGITAGAGIGMVGAVNFRDGTMFIFLKVFTGDDVGTFSAAHFCRAITGSTSWAHLP